MSSLTDRVAALSRSLNTCLTFCPMRYLLTERTNPVTSAVQFNVAYDRIAFDPPTDHSVYFLPPFDPYYGASIYATQKPSAAFLAKVLRDPRLWPHGFRFSYASIEQCAMGLAARIWGFDLPRQEVGEWERFANRFDLTPYDASRIFLELHSAKRCITSAVTALDVAHALELAAP